MKFIRFDTLFGDLYIGKHPTRDRNSYLLNTYNEADLSFSSYEKDELASALAYDGRWKAYFACIADCLKRYALQRDKQKGEYFVHGFTLAVTAQNRFYRPVSETDTEEMPIQIR